MNKKKKSVKDWKIELPKLKDVILIENALKEEKLSDTPRKGVIDMLQNKINLLTIKPSDINIEESIVIGSKEISVVEPSIKAIVLHNTKDVLLILEPYKIKLSSIDIDKIVWKDTNDKIGFQNIKINIKALSVLRNTIEAERKSFNAPYSQVISTSNIECGKVVGDIKALEDILKNRKKDYDVLLAKEKEEIAQNKAAELFKKQQEANELKEKNTNIEKQKVLSSDFQDKYGSIISRAKENLKTSEIDEEDNPFETQKDLFTGLTGKELIPIQEVLTDESILNFKLQLLEKVLKFDTPNAEKYIKACRIIDSNVSKIIEHIKSKFL